MDTTKAAASHLPDAPAPEPGSQGLDFIRSIVADDLRQGVYRTIITRFPPEPNGYLHVGHAKSIVLNFGIAAETGGRCHLRFDDTNPETEDAHYVESIQDTVRWLGFDWGEHLYFASDYFPQMYALAEFLIQEGKAYVDDAAEEVVREARGTVTEPGRPTPSRGRSPEENLDLFRRMRAGEFPNGSRVLRAKIDLASPNMLLRDPILYRIRHAHHYRTGDRWCIYPLYDYAHPIEDAIECVTHSLCTLEFENNRPLYEWVVDAWLRFGAAGGAQGGPDQLDRAPQPCHPHQYEFARGNVEYTIVSKRKLLELVRGGHVSGWDDPRMPTLAGMRRRGFTPESIRSFWEGVGVTKADQRIDVARLEHAIRDDLNRKAPRVLCVLNPLKVTITNYPEGESEELDAPLYPHDVPLEGSRPLPFSRELWIERDDFMEDPPKGYHRLAPGREVRLRYAYLVTCQEVVRDERGEVVELRCTYDPATRGGNAPDGRTVRGTIHWVSAAHALACEVRLYDRLFSAANPEAGEDDFKTHLNPDSLVTIAGAWVEPSVRDDAPGSHYQFERLGYFCSDRVESAPNRLVFNRTVTLRDTWARTAAAAAEPQSRAPKPKAKPAAPPRSAAPPAEVHRSAELEEARRRFRDQLGLGEDEAEILSRETAEADFFEAAVAAHPNPRSVANWMIHELRREIGARTLENLPFSGADFGALVALVDDSTLSSSGAREVLAEMVQSGGEPAAIVDRLGLRQVSDADALAPVVDQILTANPAKVEEYRGGKLGLLGFFVGQAMRQTGGRANPELLKEMIVSRLEK